MRRHRPAQVILPMLALPLLLVGLAMLVLPEPSAYAQTASHERRADAAHGKQHKPARKRHNSHFTLIPRSLMP